MRVLLSTLALIAFGQAAPSAAAIVECTDARGVSILSSNVDGAGCPGSTRPAPRTARASTVSTTPAGFPRVDTATQRARDSDRALILRDELEREQRRLVATEGRLRVPPGAGGETDPAELVAALARTRENIRALQAELAGVR